MRLQRIKTVAIPIVLLSVFGAGYFSRGISTGQGEQSEQPGHGNLAANACAQQVGNIPGGNNQIKADEQASANLKAINAAIQDPDQINDPLAGVLPPPDTDLPPPNPYEGKSGDELIGVLEDLLAQKKPLEELQSHDALMQLIPLMQYDPAAQKLVMDKFKEAAGTPLGDLLVTALAGSGNSEIQATALQLIKEGDNGQRLQALKVLEQTNTQSTDTRKQVLELLKNDASADPKVSLAALNTLARKDGAISLADQQDVVDSVVPYLNSRDPALRGTSLSLMAQWDKGSPATIKALTEAASDPSPDVRMTALANMAQSGASFDEVRHVLLSALQNPKEDLSVIVAAQQALQAYPLDEQAMAIYQQSIDSTRHEPSLDGSWQQTVVPGSVTGVEDMSAMPVQN